MISRISLAAGLLALFAPVLGAQPTTAWRPKLRAPRLVPDSALLSLARSSPIANGHDLPARVQLRFDPFTREHRAEGLPESRPSPRVTELPLCPMPVKRLESVRDSMPVTRPDSTREYFIRVAPPQCIAEPAR